MIPSFSTLQQTLAVVAGIICMLTSTSLTSAADPPLCLMGTCQCTRHRDDDTIATLSCVNMNLTKIPNLRSFPNLTQL